MSDQSDDLVRLCKRDLNDNPVRLCTRDLDDDLDAAIGMRPTIANAWLP